MTFSDETATSLLPVVLDRLTDINKARKGEPSARPATNIDDGRKT